jgi:hypothetical protein
MTLVEPTQLIERLMRLALPKGMQAYSQEAGTSACPIYGSHANTNLM